MQKIKLRPVIIDPGETCVTFAMKRLGIAEGYRHIKTLQHDHFVHSEVWEIIQMEPETKLRHGDIVVWSSKAHQCSVANEIDTEGRILSHTLLLAKHCGVYEVYDNSYPHVTDVTRRTDFGTYMPCLRQRLYASLPAPDYLIRFIAEQREEI